jgi:putative ABC transport system substrate-binding protein
MRRRDFIISIGGAAAAWPLTAHGQQAMPVVGFFGSQSPELWADRLRAFQLGMSETGYVEGQNVAIEYRWARGEYDRLPALAADLVSRRVTVIAAGDTTTALAAKAATPSIPIAFTIAADPVKSGLVASLNRPGGNATGVTNLGRDVEPKRMELLHELVPAATIVGLLVNPTNPNAETQSKDARAAARSLGLQIHTLYASTERDFDSAFASMAQLRVGGLVIGTDSFFSSRSEQLAAAALRYLVPAIYQYREFATAGGLMSYGGSATDGYRLVGIYTGRILKGEKPADLPVQLTTKVELFINLKTAKALRITFPLTLLGRADEAIE